MKTLSIVKAGLGGGAAILLAGLLAAGPAAQASTGKTGKLSEIGAIKGPFGALPPHH